MSRRIVVKSLLLLLFIIVFTKRIIYHFEHNRNKVKYEKRR